MGRGEGSFCVEGSESLRWRAETGGVTWGAGWAITGALVGTKRV